MTTAPLHLLAAAAIAATALLAAAPGAQAQGAKGNNIVIVLPEEPTGLDGCNMDSSFVGRPIRQNIAETLTEIDPNDGTVKARLATTWEKVDDKTWRFKLRPGVKFTDGAPMTAANAAAAIERIMSKEAVTNAQGAKAGLDCTVRTRMFSNIAIKGKAIDDLTLEVSADKPVPILPTQMGIVPIMSPNTPKDKLTNEPIGSGPYVYVNWISGQEINLKRNENYWGAKPEIEGVKFVWRNESSVRAAMVKIGEADFAPQIAPQEATDPKMDVSYLNAETTWLRIDMTRKPMDDVRIRRAMNHAIDRNALRGSILPKDIIPATQVVIPSVFGHNHELDKKVWSYDPAKAKALIAEAKAAGAPVDREIQLIGRTSYYPNGQEVLEAMMGMLTAVGFNIKLQMLEVGQWNSVNRKPWAEDRPAILLQSMHDNDKGDASFSAYPRYGCEALTSNVCDPELDKKINNAATLIGEARAKAYQEVFQILYDEIVPDINMFHMVGYSRVGSRIDFKPSVATNAEIQIAHMKLKK